MGDMRPGPEAWVKQRALQRQDEEGAKWKPTKTNLREKLKI